MHKDAIGQDINPDDIVAYSSTHHGAGFLFGRVVGETPKRIKIAVRYSLADAIKPVGSNIYGSPIDPDHVIVINKAL